MLLAQPLRTDAKCSLLFDSVPESDSRCLITMFTKITSKALEGQSYKNPDFNQYSEQKQNYKNNSFFFKKGNKFLGK